MLIEQAQAHLGDEEVVGALWLSVKVKALITERLAVLEAEQAKCREQFYKARRGDASEAELENLAGDMDVYKARINELRRLFEAL